MRSNSGKGKSNNNLLDPTIKEQKRRATSWAVRLPMARRKRPRTPGSGTDEAGPRDSS